MSAAENGHTNALRGFLGSPTARGDAVQIAVSPDDGYAFVTREAADDLAVFDLRDALLHGFSSQDFVGRTPLGVAPAGLVVAPNGRWLYVTSEGRTVNASVGSGGAHRLRPSADTGILSVLDLARAETRPRYALASTIPAGNDPVRVATGAGGRIVWVTARGSDALLGFSAAKLLADPRHALIARVKVGPAPVGLALFRHDTRIVVADSNRFSSAGACGSLSVIDTSAALRGRPATLGTIPAGGFPRQMALRPGGAVLLVTDYASGQLQAVNVSNTP